MSHELKQTKQDIVDTNKQLKVAKQKLKRFTSPIKYNAASAPVYDIPLSNELQQYTYDTCRYYGVEDYYVLILAMMWQESNYPPDLFSDTDDYGLMQINICNHESLRELLGNIDFLDEYDNIYAGVYVISTLLREYEDEHKALMAYNMGPSGARAQWKRGNTTSTYSSSIVAKAKLIELNQYK